MSAIRFHLLGTPVGKERPRAVRTPSGRVRVITAQKTREYEQDFRLAARQAVANLGLEAPLEGAVALSVVIALPVPESWSRARKAAALAGQVLPAVKPDGDNVLKAVADAMNGVVYRDDAQAVDIHVSKRYGTLPGVRVTVEPMGES